LKKVLLPDQCAEILFDLRDRNVRLLESLFQVRIGARGPRVFIQGDEKHERILENILTDFSSLVSNGCSFSNGELREAFQQIAEGAAESLHDFFPKALVLKTPIREVSPRSLNQSRYVQAIYRNDLVFGIGPAGTGKTYLAVATAVSFLLDKKVQRIVLSRPAVEAGERLGFLPGDLQEKVNPYLRPLSDALIHVIGAERVRKLMAREIIEIAPLAFMRGRTLGDSFIILDEAQNCTSEQMKMFLTRLGEGARAVITGDITQVDLPRRQDSGLIHVMSVLSQVQEVCFVHLGQRDVVRSALVRKIVRAYEAAEQPLSAGERSAAAPAADTMTRRRDGGPS
jgi:phosphate starvation-inducible PhoH-like protein